MATHVRHHDYRRLDSFTEGGKRYPRNWESKTGHYLRVDSMDGNIFFHRSSFSYPPFGIQVQATFSEMDTYSAVIEDHEGAVIIDFQRGDADIYEIISLGGDGETFEAPVMMFPGGKFPCIQIDAEGQIIRSALLGSTIIVKRQASGASGPETPFSVRNPAGSAIPFADIPFWICPLVEFSAQWFLIAVPLGFTTPSLYLSGDDCETWRDASFLLPP